MLYNELMEKMPKLKEVIEGKVAEEMSTKDAEIEQMKLNNAILLAEILKNRGGII